MNETVRELRAAATARLARAQYAAAVVRHRADANEQMLAGRFQDAGRSLRWADAVAKWGEREVTR